MSSRLKAQTIVEHNWQIAFNVMWKNSISSIDEQFENLGDAGLKDIFEDYMETPESEMIKINNMSSLSSEAKEIIDLIFNSPKEILELITSPTYKIISKGRIKKFLHKQRGWKNTKIESCFKELRELTNTF